MNRTFSNKKKKYLTSRFLWMILALSTISSAFDLTYQRYDVFLQKYVCPQGVNYEGVIRDNAALSVAQEISSLSSSGFDTLDQKDRIAYLINVYNVYTIILIVKNYPLKTGIRDIKRPWSTRFVPLFGDTVTLDYIEHTLLRKKFDEPRIHFALVCASKGCPALSNRAFTGQKLSQQLEASARTFLTDTAKNRVSAQALYLSEIFKWYGSDFSKKYGGYKNFICTTLNLQGTFSVSFLDYDWRLNSAPCR